MRTVAVLLLYLAVLTFGTHQAFGPILDSRFARTQTERCDGMFNHYVLEHSWQVVSNPDYRGSLFSPPCFFPETGTLWYSEHLLGVAPVYWALRLIVPYDLAYQWWQILADALNFVAFAMVVRWLRGPHVLALLGGYLWAFALVHVDQIKHQQMIPRFWMPLAAYHAWTFALVPTARSLNRMLACTGLQCLTCVYTGWFLVCGLAVFLPVAFGLRVGGWRDLRQFIRENRRSVWRIASGWGGVLVLAYIPYLIVNWGMVRSYEECEGMIPTPSSWFTGPPGTVWYQTTAPYRSWVSDECLLFCGFGVYVLMLVASAYLFVVRGPDRPPEFALASATMVTVLIWGLLAFTPYNGGPTLWHLARIIPGGGAIRCVSRVYAIVYLFGTLGAIVWLGLVTAHLRPWVRNLLLCPIAAVVIFEQTGYKPPSFEKIDFYSIANRAAIQIQGADAAYVVPEYTDTKGDVSGGIYGEVMSMWVGLRANVPVVNGYSGRWPPGDHPHVSRATDDMLRVWLSGRFRGKLAIVDPDHPEATRVIAID